MEQVGKKPGRAPIHAWDVWFLRLAEGKPLRLRSGVDFHIPPESMRRSVLAEAKKRGVVIRSELLEGRSVLRFHTGRPTYPWDRWLDGERHHLFPGTDFQVPVEVMRAMARRAAKQRGLGLRSTLRSGGLWIQALPAEASS